MEGPVNGDRTFLLLDIEYNSTFELDKDSYKMASQCRAKNPATCRNHGYSVSPEQIDPPNDEAGKKEFFGASIWNKVTAMQERKKNNEVVREALKNISRDIDGFVKMDDDYSRKSIVSWLNDPMDSVVKHEGDLSNAAFMIREHFADYESGPDDGPSALATVRLFRALGREDELSAGLEAKAYNHAQTPAIGASFEAQAEAMVHVLNKHKIVTGGKYLRREILNFTRQVHHHANSTDSHNSMELTYRGSNVRLWVDARVIDNKVKITKVQATDHPIKNPNMDYEGLSNDLASIFNR